MGCCGVLLDQRLGRVDKRRKLEAGVGGFGGFPRHNVRQRVADRFPALLRRRNGGRVAKPVCCGDRVPGAQIKHALADDGVLHRLVVENLGQINPPVEHRGVHAKCGVVQK